MTLLHKKVIISGLKSRKDLNGKSGKVISYDKDRNRYYIQLGDTTSNSNTQFDNLIALKEENILLSESFPSSSTRRNGHDPSQYISNLIAGLVKVFGNIFREGNLGIAASVLLLSSVLNYRATHGVFFAFLSVLLVELSVKAEDSGLLSRETNFLRKVRSYHKSLEFRLGIFLTQSFGRSIQGNHALAFASIFVSAYKIYTKNNSYPYYDDFDDLDGYGESSIFGGGSGIPFNIGGISIISLIFLGLIIYKLDIPNNGLGALRNLNFFEMMYLFDMVQRIFNGNNTRRGRVPGGYGGYGGYGRRRRGFGGRGFW